MIYIKPCISNGLVINAVVLAIVSLLQPAQLSDRERRFLAVQVFQRIAELSGPVEQGLLCDVLPSI